MRPYREGESLQNIIQTAIPDFVEADYPLFVEFVKTYIRFLEERRVTVDMSVFPEFGHATNDTVQATETYGGSVYEARKLLEYRDVATSLDEFTKHFLAMFAKNFPKYAYIPADLLVKSLRQFYQSKGTTDSIAWFFRAFFNEPATVYFPREDILKASDGTWKAPITLKVSAPIANPITGIISANPAVPQYYTGQRVQTNTGSAQVESVATSVVGQAYNQNIIVNELTLKFGTILGSFEPGQQLHNIDSEAVVYTTILPVISSVVVNAGGSNYLPGDLVSFSEGPSGGNGYGASGVVSAVASTAISGVLILDGGDGYVVGLPVSFTSTTGSGASAIISQVIYGDFDLEDGTGHFLDESSTDVSKTYIIQEDRNTLLLELVIEPFVNATATVTLDSADYGVATGVTAFDGLTLDSAIEIALAAGDEKPFMRPWVFTNSLHTTVELANVAVMLTLGSNNAFFANGVEVFAIATNTDATTNLATSDVSANVIVSDISVGSGLSMLYLKQVANLAFVNTNIIFKESGNGIVQVGTVVTDGTANVVGANTIFNASCRANTHIRFADGTQRVVRNVVNNTFLQTFTPVGVSLASNTYSVVPTGTVTSVIQQEQVFYGKIREITLLTNGDHYQTLPLVTAKSVDAQAQAIKYLDPDITGNTANNLIVDSGGQIDVYREASLLAQQSVGQVTRITVTASGVNYTDANAVVVLVIHGDGRTGSIASATPVLGAITHYPGHFTTTRGFLSSDKYLQDSEYYNNYTYVVKVAESFDRYSALLLKLMHPVGFKALGRYVELLEAPVPALRVEEELSITP